MRGSVFGASLRSRASWRVASSAADSSRLAWRLPSPPLPRRVQGAWRSLLLAGIRRWGGRRCGRIDLGASVLFRDGGCRTGHDGRDNADGRATAGRDTTAASRRAAADGRPTTRRPASAGVGRGTLRRSGSGERLDRAHLAAGALRVMIYYSLNSV